MHFPCRPVNFTLDLVIKKMQANAYIQCMCVQVTQKCDQTTFIFLLLVKSQYTFMINFAEQLQFF